MAHILTKVQGAAQNIVPVKRALLSVSDKTGLVELGRCLASFGVELLSTGGTARKLRDAGLKVVDAAEFTGFPEMLDGRVKTLHPAIHGGILAVRGNDEHAADMKNNGLKEIDMVVVNLYAFAKTVAAGSDFATCVENIDIGGPSMLRSSAKNHASVAVVTDPSQYADLIEELKQTSGATSFATRKRFAAAAFAKSAAYDAQISSYFAQQVGNPGNASDATELAHGQPVDAARRDYQLAMPLRYGCNPHQKPAACYTIGGAPLPFEVLNGSPGYINLLDALNAWSLVRELKQALGTAAAASFKHVSPAGAAVAVPLAPAVAEAYEAGSRASSPVSLAYLRARNADPMSSFGDFAAVSEVVDVALARILKFEVSDGIIAPGYEPEALEILKGKKKGRFLVLKGDPNLEPPREEWRELHGACLQQKRNDTLFTASHLENVVTKSKNLPDGAVRDLVLGNICLKYTQSNSVGFALDGQMVGVGAGQQSRVDCVKLAARKLRLWYLRQHPKVLGMQFKKGSKRQNRVNARVRYIEGDMTANEYDAWKEQFEVVPEPLTESDKREFLKSLDGVALSSDAFFPFRDSIDCASQVGVRYVAQAGGSTQDAAVTAACDGYGMTMAMSGVRLFHH
jgi:phosphoribosylaminoimidazolecarboxamide formyltransferase/IMP cyclohydrolase